MKKILHLTLFLGLISAVAGGLLATVNEMTAPIIADNAMASEKKSLEELVPNGNFTIIDVTVEDAPVIKAFKDENAGWAIKAEVSGYKEKLIFFTLIGNDGKINGFKMLQNNDTVGFGSRVSTNEFIDGVIGKTAGDKIDTLAGATVSSKAVVDGIDKVVEFYNANK